MRLCVIPGSFDPPTNGHVDLIRRASTLFENVVVLVAKNSGKTCLFSASERKEMLEDIFSDSPKIRVDVCGGLVANYASQIGADTLVRGIRNAADYSYETEIYQVNKTICPGLETVFIPASTSLSSIRSSSIRELALYDMDVSLFVPEVVNRNIIAKRKSTVK